VPTFRRLIRPGESDAGRSARSPLPTARSSQSSVTQEYTGKSPYFTDLDENSSRLLVAVVCFVEEIPQPVYALLDTVSPWCVLPPSVASRLGLDLTNGEETTS